VIRKAKLKYGEPRGCSLHSTTTTSPLKGIALAVISLSSMLPLVGVYGGGW